MGGQQLRRAPGQSGGSSSGAPREDEPGAGASQLGSTRLALKTVLSCQVDLDVPVAVKLVAEEGAFSVFPHEAHLNGSSCPEPIGWFAGGPCSSWCSAWAACLESGCEMRTGG